MKVMTIVGTRPELIKLSCVIPALDEAVNHVLVHTGQNHDYELNQVFFEELGVRQPDHFMEVAGGSAMEAIARILVQTEEVLSREAPDAVLFYGDTNSCLGVMAAKRRHIPIFHMEAGNRCFDSRVPEEINRKVVDHLSDVNMPLTEHARRYLLAEGCRPELTIKTGSPMREVLEKHRVAIESSDVLDRLDLVEGEYFLVSAHREENVDRADRLHELVVGLSALADEYDMPVIVSTHPRTRNRLEALDEGALLDPRVRFLKPFGFFDYVHLQLRSRCALSDSGTITEEAAILDFPAITIREAHERPEGMDQGVLVMSSLDKRKLLQAVDVVVSQHRKEGRVLPQVPDYQGARVSEQVVRVILSYTDYINRVVWQKHG
jgi:UDP-N-acetylglucosamine 2-epimerase (non-hydrolysing)